MNHKHLQMLVYTALLLGIGMILPGITMGIPLMAFEMPYHRFTLRPTSTAELKNHLYLQIFMTAGFIISIPAIILQLILISLLMEALRHSGIIQYQK